MVMNKKSHLGAHSKWLLFVVLQCAASAGVLGIDSIPTPKFLPPVKVSAAPKTVVSSMKVSVQIITTALQKMKPGDAYTRYLVTMKKARGTSDLLRQSTFMNSLRQVQTLNADRATQHVSATNFFADSPPPELLSKYLGFKGMTDGTGRRSLLVEPFSAMGLGEIEVNASFARHLEHRGRALMEDGNLDGIPDWSIIMPAVKFQGACAACWAFTAAALAESAHYIKTGEMVSLSEKELLDCSTSYNGCSNGGYLIHALNYMMSQGVTTSAVLPYSAQKGTCPNPQPNTASRIAGYMALPAQNEAAMLEALRYGPMAVSVTVDQAWFPYAGGVYTSTGCRGGVNHAVVIVGAGVDKVTSTPYWLIRNSWGPNWGESGYMRILRGTTGTGMCNLALYNPIQVVSADIPASPSSPPPPATTICMNNYTARATDSVVAIARRFNASVSQVMIENNLYWRNPLKANQKLNISCPEGFWSQAFGVWANGNQNNGMSEVPTVAICPAGAYATAFTVTPSKWSTKGAVSNLTWVGGISMVCSDGTEMAVDAQIDSNAGFPSGTATQINGFTSVPIRSGWAIDNVFGVGALTGTFSNFSCPNNTLITGFSGGASVQYPRGWLANLQFYCSNPFGNSGRLQSLRSSAAPTIKSGTSCATIKARNGDNWFSISSRQNVDIFDLIRANPKLTKETFTANDVVFLPPCEEGVYNGS